MPRWMGITLVLTKCGTLYRIFQLPTQFQWLDAKTANFGKDIHRSTETTASVNDSELSQQGVMIFARSERKRAKNRR